MNPTNDFLHNVCPQAFDILHKTVITVIICIVNEEI